MDWKEAVLDRIQKSIKETLELLSTTPVGGGSINATYRFETTKGNFFVKKNSASRFPEMFSKESRGLKVLMQANEIAVPEVVALGEKDDATFLVLKYIQSRPKNSDFWDSFAKNLSNLHKHSAENFGLDHNNYIGSLPQSNKNHDKWSDFFWEERLEVQLKLARDNRKIGRETVSAFEKFSRKIEEIFPIEKPALIHGDLWGGNFMVGEDGEAVIIDPAVYYGHREMDLGMSQLFGGFALEFYEAYHSCFPLEQGWQERMDYCNLYPLMVHVNLFGGGYLGSVMSILNRF